MSVTMPVKEYLYLKNLFPFLDSYIINIAYAKEFVTLDFLYTKKEIFKIEYNALIVRVGLEGKETYNETGYHLIDIYDSYFHDAMDS